MVRWVSLICTRATGKEAEKEKRALNLWIVDEFNKAMPGDRYSYQLPILKESSKDKIQIGYGIYAYQSYTLHFKSKDYIGSFLYFPCHSSWFPIPTNTAKKSKYCEGNLERENVKSLSNSVTKFCDQGICEGFYFFRH